jgi:hypothetical protein
MDEYSTKTLVKNEEKNITASRFLTPQQVAMIEEALMSLGDYGELRLIVERGRLRFLVTHKSFDALKWKPGDLISHSK